MDNRLEGESMAIVLANRLLAVVRTSGAASLEIYGALDVVRALVPTMPVSLTSEQMDLSSPEQGWQYPPS
jgi:hypothetical protein